MPSPFPGMDPYLEGPEWPDFHHCLMEVIREQLLPQALPHYHLRLERRMYLDRVADSDPELCVPDVIIQQRAASQPKPAAASPQSATTAVECLLPLQGEFREAFLQIRDAKNSDVITILELLSPANKQPGSRGRRLYLRKRNDVLTSRTNLVEIDLLLGGRRLPMASPLPDGDYFAVVSPARKRPKADVMAWRLADHLPRIGIPVKDDDADLHLDLQAAIRQAFDRARYDLALPYGQPLPIPLPTDYATWILQQSRSASPTV